MGCSALPTRTTVPSFANEGTMMPMSCQLSGSNEGVEPKMPKPNKLKSMMLVFSALVCVGALFIVSQPHSGRAGQPTVILDLDDGGVRYTASFDPMAQRVDATRNYDYLSEAGIRRYIATNQTRMEEFGQRNAGRLRVNVVFSHPLTQAEFAAFARDYDLVVHSYQMRAVERDGKRVTIAGAPYEGTLVPEQFMNMALDDIAARGAAEFKGWIETEVTTVPAQLRKMQLDKRIVVLEVGPTLVLEALTRMALRQAGATSSTMDKLQNKPDREVIQISGPSLYWGLEDIGLVAMPVYSGR